MTVTTPDRTSRMRAVGSPAPRVQSRRRRHAARPRVSSLPFLGGVAALLATALLALLMINNTLAVGSFEQSRLKSEQILLGEQEQALRQEVERLSSPTRVREAARQAGLVAAATTVYLDPETGRILGIPAPAGQATAGLPVTDPLAAPPVGDPAAVADPAAVGDPATAGDPAAGNDPAAGATAAVPGEDGAAVGAPEGSTAYDRAVVSGGGR